MCVAFPFCAFFFEIILSAISIGSSLMYSSLTNSNIVNSSHPINLFSLTSPWNSPHAELQSDPLVCHLTGDGAILYNI